MTPDKKKDQKYSYADYLTWTGEDHVELTIYEEYGVKEYWIVNPDRKTIQIFIHNGQEYDKPDYYKGEDVIKSSVLNGFHIALMDIFN